MDAAARNRAVLGRGLVMILGFGVFNLSTAGVTWLIVAAVACESKTTCAGGRSGFVATWIIMTQSWAVAVAFLATRFLTRRPDVSGLRF